MIRTYEATLPEGLAAVFLDDTGNVVGIIATGDGTEAPNPPPTDGPACTIDRDWRRLDARPPEYALGTPYPVERRPGWSCVEDRWTGEWVYTRDADGAEVRIMQGGTWDDADVDLDAFEMAHPVKA